MKSESDEMKARLVHQMAEDFYSRFESTEDKLKRLRKLQQGEQSLPSGLEIEGDIRLPDATDMHSMLLSGVHGTISVPEIKAPEQVKSKDKMELDVENGTYL